MQIQGYRFKTWGWDGLDWECDIPPEELVDIRSKAHVWMKALADEDSRKIEETGIGVQGELGGTCYRWWREGLSASDLALINKFEKAAYGLPPGWVGQAFIWPTIRYRESETHEWVYLDGMDSKGQRVKATKPRKSSTPEEKAEARDRKREKFLRESGLLEGHS